MHILAEFGENDFGGILADLRRVRPVYARPKKRPFQMFGEGREFDKHLLAFALSKFVLTQCFGQSKTLSENKFIKMFAPNMPHICRSMPHILLPFATVCRGICANLREYHQNYPPQIRPAYAFAV